MATKIRLQRHGRKKAPFYHIVVADVNAPRDGKFIERLGLYNPTTVPAQISIDVDKAVQWLQNGAQPTTTVNAILRYKGVLYKKHLLRGVKKGAFSMEVAEQKFAEWIKAHEGAVMDHISKVEQSKASAKASEIARLNAKRLEAASKKAAEAKAAEEAAKAEAEAENAETEQAENTETVEAEVENTSVENTAEETAAGSEEPTNE
ncbi:MAG: 30S ribosomal protein S16 [Chitinophagales bacterium]